MFTIQFRTLEPLETFQVTDKQFVNTRWNLVMRTDEDLLSVLKALGFINSYYSIRVCHSNYTPDALFVCLPFFFFFQDLSQAICLLIAFGTDKTLRLQINHPDVFFFDKLICLERMTSLLELNTNQPPVQPSIWPHQTGGL